MKRLRKVLLWIAALVLTAFFVMCWLASSRLLCPPRRTLQDYHREILANAADHGMSIRPFEVKTTPCLLCEPLVKPGAAVKGNKLRAELAAEGMKPAPWGEVKATLVLLHGHGGRKEDHLPVAERFCAAGFRCLLMDLPGHGEHPAPYACFGVKEAGLPYEVLRAASQQFGFPLAPAGLFGISQGGAIALQAAAHADEKWFAVAELSSFSTLDEVITGHAPGLFGPLHGPAALVVRELIQLRAGYDPRQVRPVEAAAKLTQPVLIGHGDADVFVSPAHGQRLFEAVISKQKQYLDVPGAGHSNVLVTAVPVYAPLAMFFLKARP